MGAGEYDEVEPPHPDHARLTPGPRLFVRLLPQGAQLLLHSVEVDAPRATQQKTQPSVH